GVWRGSSKYGSEKLSDIVWPKSSIGEISSKISCSPAISGTSSRPSLFAVSTRPCQVALPTSQSKLSVWMPRRLGTSIGSEICAKEIRGDAERLAMAVAEGVREAAKGGSFPLCSVRVASPQPHTPP